MLTYLIVSKYLTKDKIDAYFKPKGWKRSKKGQPNLITLIYLDGLNIYKFYSLNTFIKNAVGEKKHLMSNKKYLELLVDKKYLPNSYLYNTEETLEKYKGLFKKDKKLILKPVAGSTGIGIIVVDSYQKLEEFFNTKVKNIDFGRIKETDQWVFQEYIDNPMLYEGRKFHIRIYFMLLEDQVFYFDKFTFFTAALKYKNSDYSNKNIHVSHRKGSIKDLIIPDNLQLDFDIQKDVKNIFKSLKSNIMLPVECYPESKKCYEIFAADVMLNDKNKLKVLEFNTYIGPPDIMDSKYPIFENQLDIVLNHYGLLEEIDMENNSFIKI